MSENSGLSQGNAEKPQAWNMSSYGDSGIRPVMGASSWPDTNKSQPDKSSSDSLKSLNNGSVSVPLSLSEQNDLFGALRSIKPMNDSASTSSGQCSYDFTKFTCPELQNQRIEIASQSHGGTQNQYQQKSNQNVNPHNHQSHGVRSNQEHVHQNCNLHRNFNGRGSGFRQPPRGTPGHAPPPSPSPSPRPPMASIYTQYMQVYQPNYPFVGHVIFPDFAPPIMYYSARVPFVEPIPSVYQVQDYSLEFRIRDQVHYYFSLENLSTDYYMCKHMDDEGFVHIQFIAGFNKLKALTNNIELIRNALRDSNVVELKGYEIRRRDMWKRFLMPRHLRMTFNLESNSRDS